MFHLRLTAEVVTKIVNKRRLGTYGWLVASRQQWCTMKSGLHLLDRQQLPLVLSCYVKHLNLNKSSYHSEYLSIRASELQYVVTPRIPFKKCLRLPISPQISATIFDATSFRLSSERALIVGFFTRWQKIKRVALDTWNGSVVVRWLTNEILTDGKHHCNNRHCAHIKSR